MLSNSATETTDIVSLDPARITQAIVQLAENAVKYAAESLVFEIGYSGLPHEARFWVADQGPGIAPEHRERIFQRFGRVDAGRGIQGSGLGLAIVQAIAVSHGGSVTLESSSQGSTFSIVIPRSK